MVQRERGRGGVTERDGEERQRELVRGRAGGETDREGDSVPLLSMTSRQSLYPWSRVGHGEEGGADRCSPLLLSPPHVSVEGRGGG